MSKRLDELSEKYDLPIMVIRNFEIDASVIAVIPPVMVNRFKVIPISRIGSCLTVAIAEPNDDIKADITFLTDYFVEFVLSDPDDISQAIRRYYPTVSNKINIHEYDENSGVHVIEKVIDQEDPIIEEIGDLLSNMIKDNVEKYMKLFGRDCDLYDYSCPYNKRTPEGLVIVEFEKILTNKRSAWSLMDVNEKIVYIKEDAGTIRKMKILYQEGGNYLIQPLEGGKVFMITVL